MERLWRGTGPAYELPWGGRTWTLRVDDPRPGLRSEGIEAGPFLGLEGVAERGRWDPDALSGATLVGHECRLGRVEATYAPPGWGDLSVRAAWSPQADDGIDLQIQINALSVGRLRAVEVKLASVLGAAAAGSPRQVEPRDARSAGLSYDGREPDLHGLITLPPGGPGSFAPLVLPAAGLEGWRYAEMVHPEDVSRRILEGGPAPQPCGAIRCGLFGYDLERGVVLRARLRGLWLRAEGAEAATRARFEQFVREPLPLMT
ncbi:MAG TPA: hypothetical protein VF590_03290 [Isosphaeraceae bacterium]|jgi:hypothetical protein